MVCASARPVAAPNMPGWGAERSRVGVAVALARLGVEGARAGAGVPERAGELVLEPVEVGAAEAAAERQQLGASDCDEQEAVAMPTSAWQP